MKASMLLQLSRLTQSLSKCGFQLVRGQAKLHYIFAQKARHLIPGYHLLEKKTPLALLIPQGFATPATPKNTARPVR